MTAFDPYYKWLGIPPSEQPPDLYRLLGLRPFEQDVDVIQNAADQRMVYLRTFQAGKFSDQSQRLLNEVAAARLQLLNPERKRQYDDELHRLQADDERVAAALPVDVPSAPSPLASAAVAPPPVAAELLDALPVPTEVLQKQSWLKTLLASPASHDRAAAPAARIPASPRPESPAAPRIPAGDPARARRPTKPKVASRDELKELEAAHLRGGSLWKGLLACLTSLTFHIVLLFLLILWTIGQGESAPELPLSLEASVARREGGVLSEEIVTRDEFDLPIDKSPTNSEEREALVKANQDAKELRLDADEGNLPSLDRVKGNLQSDDPYRRMQAARDPRIRAKVVRQEGGTILSEAAVARALRWMSSHQNEDGSWSLHNFHKTHQCNGRCAGGGNIKSDTAGTAMVLMAMLGTGQTHKVGIYRENVSRGLRWLIQHQGDDGDLRANTASNAGMYAHGQAAIVLADAFKVTGDETLRRPAQKAIDFIVAAQHEAGGWRYRPGQAGDLSVVGRQLMAMHSAKSAFLDVPRQTSRMADRFLDTVQSDKSGGLYGYTPGSGATPAMTAEGILSRMYLGWDRSQPGLEAGVTWLIENHLPSRKSRPNIYYWYYGTQVMHHWGGEPWEQWNLAMRDVLVTSQETKGHEAGSWSPKNMPHGSAGGRLYVTALSACTLEVYYRYAPLYRKLDLD